MYHEVDRKTNGYGTHADHMPLWLTIFSSFRYVGVYTTVLVALVARRTVEFVHGLATGAKAVAYFPQPQQVENLFLTHTSSMKKVYHSHAKEDTPEENSRGWSEKGEDTVCCVCIQRA